jgi:hypothetical protein
MSGPTVYEELTSDMVDCGKKTVGRYLQSSRTPPGPNGKMPCYLEPVAHLCFDNQLTAK